VHVHDRGVHGRRIDGGVTAVLGPTNTGKTHLAIEQMLRHRTGVIGLPLRLLAREIYDRVTARIGERRVALVTGEEKRIPRSADYFICTVESMPIDREFDFVCVDEVQLASHRQRGHTFTERLLHARGVAETWLLGADTMRPIVEDLLPTAEIRTNPRFSKLRYSGEHGIAALPPRTAVVAFSVDDVYQLADRVRHRHGGTAVVLGALSPRTRNAQVAMYEAGEVQYMVATDAIGMGLNLDLDRVVFAGLSKYDGNEQRELDDAEMAQIAGRAGRYTRDGEFGVLAPLRALSPARILAVEDSRLRPIQKVVWRNGALDFDSIAALLESLRARPNRACLRLVEQADDYDALLALASRDVVRRRAVGTAAIELLWDVCRIPDFRKLLVDSHAELLERVYLQLVEAGHLDEDWMAGRIARLAEDGGDIDTLMNRIAFVRTWTYITSHERWARDPKHWQERTREIEDRHSDALHRLLTERFVAREARGPAPRRGRRRTPPVSAPEVVLPRSGHPFERLATLAVPDLDAPEPDEIEWTQRLVEATDDAFGVDEDGGIAFEGHGVARLRRGADVLHPEVVTSHMSVGGGAQRRIARRVSAWLRDALAELFGPVERLLADGLDSAGRGLAYQLVQGLGTVDARRAAPQLERLGDGDRRTLERTGVVVGRAGLYVPRALGPAALRLRAALWSAHEGWDPPRRAPPRGRVCVCVERDLDAEFYPRVGYLVRGPRAFRIDALERALVEVQACAREDTPFHLPGDLSSRLGLRARDLPCLLDALGYARITRGSNGAPDRYARRRHGRR
jgi:ATP-dependent RNA helicase SUPV3L1/SUV3